MVVWSKHRFKKGFDEAFACFGVVKVIKSSWKVAKRTEWDVKRENHQQLAKRQHSKNFKYKIHHIKNVHMCTQSNWSNLMWLRVHFQTLLFWSVVSLFLFFSLSLSCLLLLIARRCVRVENHFIFGFLFFSLSSLLNLILNCTQHLNFTKSPRPLSKSE